MARKTSKKVNKKDLRELVTHLYDNYTSELDDSLWTWEMARWYELVFCILTTIGEPDVMAADTRAVTNALSEMGVLEPAALARLKPSIQKGMKTNAALISIGSLLKYAGFSDEQSKSAITALCEAAYSIKKKYGGKIQNYLRKYGDYMLGQIRRDFHFNNFNKASKALAIWLQNTLNMPVPASNPLADKACRSLGVTYKDLVEAANEQDLNVAVLDDALRVYWEDLAVEE
ncbi:MAG: hypothetical protein JSV30_02930 [Candidatus Omnitrophota bacterium]|nr:MAG: hypothetical protein JSV30_02930 [Candidatus Omnitrophota bacterium]